LKGIVALLATQGLLNDAVRANPRGYRQLDYDYDYDYDNDATLRFDPLNRIGLEMPLIERQYKRRTSTHQQPTQPDADQPWPE
jgi:hypothetical protein